MMAVRYTVDEMLGRVGAELGVSDWLTVDQGLIDGFGRSTLDMEWLHVDPERATQEGPYGGPIAFGFWTLSMLTHFSHEIGMWPTDVAYGLNYGLDRVRWLNPVPVGARIRMRCTLSDFEARGDGRFLIRTTNVVEMADLRPALIAEWLGLFVQAGLDLEPQP